MILEAQREAATKAATSVRDTTVDYGTKVKDTTVDYGTKVKDTSVDYGTKVKDTTVDYGKKAGEYGNTAAEVVADYATNLYEAGLELVTKAIEAVKDLPIGDKKVGERAEETVDKVSEAIDVDQIQDQVAKIRHQMEGVLGNWRDSFRPATNGAVEPKAATKKAPACPTCGARGDAPCMTASGNEASKPHAARKAA